jgi:hypothetical protein
LDVNVKAVESSFDDFTLVRPGKCQRTKQNEKKRGKRIIRIPEIFLVKLATKSKANVCA